MRLKVARQNQKFFRIWLSSSFLVWVQFLKLASVKRLSSKCYYKKLDLYRMSSFLLMTCIHSIQVFNAFLFKNFIWRMENSSNHFNSVRLVVLYYIHLEFRAYWGLLLVILVLWLSIFVNAFWFGNVVLEPLLTEIFHCLNVESIIFLSNYTFIFLYTLLWYRSCSMRCWRMLAVSKEQGCLPWTALAGMLGICLIVSPSPIIGLFFFCSLLVYACITNIRR